MVWLGPKKKKKEMPSHAGDDSIEAKHTVLYVRSRYEQYVATLG
jgi:hypothetical protein